MIFRLKKDKRVAAGHHCLKGQCVDVSEEVGMADPDLEPVLERGLPKPAVEGQPGNPSIEAPANHRIIRG